MGVNIPYNRGEVVYVVIRKELSHPEKRSLGYDHLGFRGYEEYRVVDGYEWEVREMVFRFGLLDEIPLDRIFKNKCAAQFKQMRLQAIDRRRENIEQSREAEAGEREAVKAKTATYNLTKDQLDALVKERIQEDLKRIKQEATDEAINTAMILLLTLPLEVLMDHYWQKSYAKRIPRFTELVLEYYTRWQNGEIDIEDLKRDLWEYGGVKLQESEESD